MQDFSREIQFPPPPHTHKKNPIQIAAKLGLQVQPLDGYSDGCAWPGVIVTAICFIISTRRSVGTTQALLPSSSSYRPRVTGWKPDTGLRVFEHNLIILMKGWSHFQENFSISLSSNTTCLEYIDSSFFLFNPIKQDVGDYHSVLSCTHEPCSG